MSWVLSHFGSGRACAFPASSFAYLTRSALPFFIFPFRCIPVPRVTEAGDSRDLGGVTQPHRGEEEEARQELRVQRRPLRTDPPGGMIPGPGSHAGDIFPAFVTFFLYCRKAPFIAPSSRRKADREPARPDGEGHSALQGWREPRRGLEATRRPEKDYSDLSNFARQDTCDRHDGFRE